MKNNSRGFAVFGVLGLAILLTALTVGVIALPQINTDIRSRAQVVSTQSTTFSIQSDADLGNADGTSITTPSSSNKTVWVGTGQLPAASFLGLRFKGGNVPAGAKVESAKLEFKASSASSTPFSFKGFVETSGSSSLTSMKLSSFSQSFTESSAWAGNQTVIYDVTSLLSQYGTSSARSSYTIALQGTGSSGARRYILGSTTTGSQPKLTVTYSIATQATSTPRATATSTPRVTAIPATPTIPIPTSTAVSSGKTSLEYGTWVPNTAYDTCSKAIHDSYFVIGEDGKKYSTWHPAVHSTGCRFGHEHGSDPKTSKADSSLPAFGYAAEQMGMLEPHTGFKVHVLAAGTTVESNISNKVADVDARMVIHMGTSGLGRYTQPLHSMEYDFIARDGSGRYLHVNGIADTGNGTGSTCTRPRDGGKDFSTVGCNDPYEIWGGMRFQVIHPSDQFTGIDQTRAGLSPSIAAFDPITTRDPNINTKLIYSHNHYGKSASISPTSPQGAYQGCDREAYHQAYFNNAGKPTVYYTDARGLVKGSSFVPGLIRQEVSAVRAGGNVIWKNRINFCGNGIHAPN